MKLAPRQRQTLKIFKIYDFKIQDFYFYGGRRAELVSYRQSLFDIPFRLKGRCEMLFSISST